MKEYLLSVVGITLLSALLIHILPQGKMNKAVKGWVRAVCLLVVISPVLAVFESASKKGGWKNFFDDFFSQTVIQTDDKYIDYCREKSVADAEKRLQTKINEKFGIQTVVFLDCESVSADTQNEESKGEWLVIKKATLEVNIEISNTLKEEIADYLQTEYNVETEWK